jgi:hypothetical protein
MLDRDIQRKTIWAEKRSARVAKQREVNLISLCMVDLPTAAGVDSMS